jgi:hypothetical protein
VRSQCALDQGGLIELDVCRDLALHPEGEVAEQRALRLGERVRLGVEHAQRADGFAARRVERMPGVEPEMRVADHERVRGEPLGLAGVFDHHRAVLADRVVAEGILTGRLLAAEPDLGLAPLAVAVEQRDAHHRHAEHLLRKPCHSIHSFIPWGVQDPEFLQRLLPPELVEHAPPPS